MEYFALGAMQKREKMMGMECVECVCSLLCFIGRVPLLTLGSLWVSDHVSFTSAFPRLVEYLHLPGQYSVNDGWVTDMFKQTTAYYARYQHRPIEPSTVVEMIYDSVLSNMVVATCGDWALEMRLIYLRN